MSPLPRQKGLTNTSRLSDSSRIPSGDTITGIFIEFLVSCGSNWWDITKQTQQTQTAYPDEENQVVWAHPIDLHFATSSIAEWPKMHFQVFKLDAFGRMDPLSVGSLNLPTQPGHYRLQCRTWSPLSQRTHEVVATLCTY